MKLTICGSMRHIDKMKANADFLTALGFENDYPDASEKSITTINSFFSRTERKKHFIDDHLAKIATSDAILVQNEKSNENEGYIGGNTLMEITAAYQQGLEIFLRHPMSSGLSYRDEVEALQPMYIRSPLQIRDYFDSLPKVALSSTSKIKERAVSRGLRRAGIRTNVAHLIDINSGVSEQPRSFDETLEGALNRHAQLTIVTKNLDVEYLATIESGNHRPFKDSDEYGCFVVIIEKIGQEKVSNANLSLAIPEMYSDLVPDVYADFGILAQQLFNSPDKDPFPYLTNNKISRLKLLEQGVFETAAQLN